MEKLCKRFLIKLFCERDFNLIVKTREIKILLEWFKLHARNIKNTKIAKSKSVQHQKHLIASNLENTNKMRKEQKFSIDGSSACDRKQNTEIVLDGLKYSLKTYFNCTRCCHPNCYH